MKSLVMGTILFAFSSPAFAGGQWSCIANHKEFSFEARGTVDRTTRGFPVEALSGSVEFKNPDALGDLGTVNFGKEQLKQQWLNEGKFNLDIIWETPKGQDYFGIANASITARRKSTGEISGTVTVYKYFHSPLRESAGLKPSEHTWVAPIACSVN